MIFHREFRGILVIVLVANLVSSCAATDPYLPTAPTTPVERPSFTAGDRWVFESKSGTRYEIIYQGLRNGTLVFHHITPTDGSNGPVTSEMIFTSDLAAISSRVIEGGPGEDTECHPHRGELQFPIFVGKSWRHSYICTSQKKDERVVETVIKGYDVIIVPAGSFPAFRIESTTRFSSGLTQFSRYWYAPAVKRVIQYQATILGGPFKVVIPAADPLVEYEFKK